MISFSGFSLCEEILIQILSQRGYVSGFRVPELGLFLIYMEDISVFTGNNKKKFIVAIVPIEPIVSIDPIEMG